MKDVDHIINNFKEHDRSQWSWRDGQSSWFKDDDTLKYLEK